MPPAAVRLPFLNDPPDQLNRSLMANSPPAIATLTRVRLLTVDDEEWEIVTPGALIETSSAEPGTALFDQLAAVCQRKSSPLPVQETAAGTVRSSNASMD